MALPGGAAGLGGGTLVTPSHITGSGHALQQQGKSKAGLFVGVGVLLVGILAAGAFIGLKGTEKAAPAPPPAPNQEVKKLKIKIKAPGAKEIKINGETESTSSEFTYVAEEGEQIKILAIASPDRKKLVRFTPTQDGEVVEIELPAPSTKKVAPTKQAAASAPIVIVQASPENARLTVNGKPLPLVKGNAKVPKLKIGDVFTVEGTATDHEPFKKEFTVRNQLETFDVKLSKVRRAAPVVASKGTVTLNAKPWAKVSLKGKSLGLTPYSRRHSTGKYTFVLTKGSITKNVSVTVRGGRTVSKTVQMN
jgi:hypothetical protein